MGKMDAKKKSTRKNIDLPTSTVEILDDLAWNGRMKTKPYMELILIEFAKNNKVSKKRTS